MASTINALSAGAGGIITAGDTSGSLALQSDGVTIATITPKGLQTNVGAPAFRAYKSSNQVVSDAVSTKVIFDTKVFDTNNNYSTANSRFTPTVAGYYQIIANVYGSSGAALSYNFIQIYKNGSADSSVVISPYQGATAIGPATTLIYLNGSTDYIEVYTALAGTGTLTIISSPIFTFFSASLARSA